MTVGPFELKPSNPPYGATQNVIVSFELEPT